MSKKIGSTHEEYAQAVPSEGMLIADALRAYTAQMFARAAQAVRHNREPGEVSYCATTASEAYRLHCEWAGRAR